MMHLQNVMDDEYQSMVQRELMILRAKKEAAELFRQEEAERERKEREEMEELKREQAHDVMERLTAVWCESLRTKQNPDAGDVRVLLRVVNEYRKRAGEKPWSRVELEVYVGRPLPK